MYAHTPAKPNGPWHSLDAHLLGVAELAERFGAKFEAFSICRALGLGHDLGKAAPAFQKYLEECAKGVKCSSPGSHSAPGAIALYPQLKLFVLPILGHHAGLPNMSDVQAVLTNPDSKWMPATQALADAMTFPDLETFWNQTQELSHLDLELLMRMCFSALVDADRLDTASHTNPDTERSRGGFSPMSDMAMRLRERMAQFVPEATTVSQVRQQVLQDCRTAASRAQGVFRLTVPTGGGKTLSSLSFAMDHALAHDLDRVIVAIPYTSIIDQTAKVYAKIVGAENMLEHHSAIDVDSKSELNGDQDDNTLRMRLAAENWDAPLIVTTTVQLFESLFSNHPSACRKVHNMARSVIILDEVQTLPTNLLTPILNGLGQLVKHYGCTVLLCTATQPNYSPLERMLPAEQYQLLRNAEEIVQEPGKHFDALKRVRFTHESEPLSAEAIADRLRPEHQALCILNTRKDAVAIARSLGPDPAVLHLSTLMCGHHRKVVLEKVRQRLKDEERVLLVSTQVVEAGVDVDFPLVYRDFGPLDRIIQAAGRCNREGKLDEGNCVIFHLEGGTKPGGSYGTACDATSTVFDEFPEFDSPEAMSRFFVRWYTSTDLDPKLDRTAPIQQLREEWAYEAVNRRFVMIPKDSVSLIVESYKPQCDPEAVSLHLASFGNRDRKMWYRTARQYSISVLRNEFNQWSSCGLIREHESGIHIYSGKYSDDCGVGIGTERDTTDLCF